MYERVLVGTDGSETAAKAVDRAFSLATSFGATLTVLSAGPDGQSVAEAEVDRLGDSPIEVVAVGSDGNPATVLADEAERGEHDLVVVGNKGLSGVRRLLPVGKVPNRLSHHLRRTLLVVKTT